MIDPEFIQRCQSAEFKKMAEDNYREGRIRQDKWKIENPEAYRERKRVYSKTEKGIIANKRKMSVRHARVREQSKLLSLEELEEIRVFYVNCPPGYHVDHVYPLSKGGRHHISNLQYLTPLENSKKHAKILPLEPQ